MPGFFWRFRYGQLEGEKLMVRRLVTGLDTGWKRQRFTADKVSLLNIRGGLELTTRAAVTAPLVPTVNSTCTVPACPLRSASIGYFGCGVLIATNSVFARGARAAAAGAGAAAAGRCAAARCSA